MTEAVQTALVWFHQTAPEAANLIAVTQSENSRTRALLLRCGAVPVRTFVEHGAEQTQYQFSGSDPTRWAALGDQKHRRWMEWLARRPR